MKKRYAEKNATVTDMAVVRITPDKRQVDGEEIKKSLIQCGGPLQGTFSHFEGSMQIHQGIAEFLTDYVRRLEQGRDAKNWSRVLCDVNRRIWNVSSELEDFTSC